LASDGPFITSGSHNKKCDHQFFFIRPDHQRQSLFLSFIESAFLVYIPAKGKRLKNIDDSTPFNESTEPTTSRTTPATPSIV
jgi:hypothetical protein